MSHHADPVCAEPKLFVGGLRFEVSRDEVFNHFSQYGPVKTCILLKHQDSGKSKGCAMVLFSKWAHAEAAVNAENGTASGLSGPRQLIVKFADPQRRMDDGVLVGVTPKKLFVGQVAKGVTHDQIRGIFAPYGEIVDLNVMEPKKDGAMGCAFVTYSSWGAAESAIEGVDGKFTLPGATNPIAVKMADAKPSDIQRVGGKRGLMDGGGGGGGSANKRQFMGPGGMAGKGGGAMMPGMANMMGMGYGGMMPGMGMGGMGMPGMMGMMGMPGMMGGGGMMAPGMMGQMGGGMMAGMMPGQQGMMGPGGGMMGPGQQQGMMQQGPQGQQGPGQQQQGQQGGGDASQVAAGGMDGSQAGAMVAGGYGPAGMGGGMMAQPGMMGPGQQGGMMAGQQGMGGGMMGPAGMMGQMGGGMMGQQGMMPGQQGMMAMGGGAGGMMGQMGMMGGGGGQAAPAGPLGLGAAGGDLQAAKAWKLFIGQISFNLSEADLFPFFSQFGSILELVLLRSPDGRNRGCGFLIYSSQAEAEAAITCANGAIMPGDMRARPLMVKYANQKMQQS